jgi:DNA repair protein RadC/inorganic pyrophosphatase
MFKTLKNLLSKAAKKYAGYSQPSLFDELDFSSPAQDDYSSKPKHVKGNPRENHKYIERKPNPNKPGEFIYIYEMPDGTQYETKNADGKPFVFGMFGQDVDDHFFSLFSRHKTPGLFDPEEPEEKKPFIFVPENDTMGRLTYSKSRHAKEYAEKNKHLIGTGLFYRNLTENEIDYDQYSNFKSTVRLLAKEGNQKVIPYSQFIDKMSKYDLDLIDPLGEIEKTASEDTYMPIAGQVILNKAEKYQAAYDRKNNTAPASSLMELEPGKESSGDLIQDYLNSKQAGKTYKDLNERVRGSRKEVAAIRKLMALDILNLDTATQYERINKKLVLPEFDPYSRKEAGESAGATYMKMKLYEAITSRPANSQVAREIYVKFVPAFMDEVYACTDYEEISKLFDKYFVKAYDRSTNRVVRKFNDNAVQKAKEVGVNGTDDQLNIIFGEDVFGKNFLNLLGMSTESAHKHRMLARQYEGHDAEKELAKKIENLNKKKEEINNLTEESIYQKILAKYDRRSTDLAYELSRNNMFEKYGNFSLSLSNFYPALNRMPETERNQMFRELAGIQLEKDRKAVSQLANEDDLRELYSGTSKAPDWSWLPDKDKEAEQSFQLESEDEPEKKEVVKEFPKLLKVIRTNGREVTDEEVTVENLQNLFGYNSVQFGNWVKDHEAREHVKHFIASMKDMEDILGIDIKKINETGGLNIAFGARGKSKALAHYEPMRKIINLTKTKGDGTISHEWAHFFDHLIGGGDPNKEDTKGFATNAKAISPEIHKIVAELMDEIYGGKETKAVEFKVPDKKPTITFHGLDPIRIMKSPSLTPEQKIEELVNTAQNILDKSFYVKGRTAELLGELIAYHAQKPISLNIHEPNSFYENSKAQPNKKYYTAPHELFARAFESYIEDKCAQNGIYNNYLVSDNSADKENVLKRNTKVYPQGNHRQKLNKIFDRLIEKTKEAYGVAKEPDTDSKRVNEVIDYTDSADGSLFNKSVITTEETTMFRKLQNLCKSKATCIENDRNYKNEINRKLSQNLTEMLQKAKRINYTSDDYSFDFPHDFSDIKDNLFDGMEKDGLRLEPAHSNPNVRRYHKIDQVESLKEYKFTTQEVMDYLKRPEANKYEAGLHKILEAQENIEKPSIIIDSMQLAKDFIDMLVNLEKERNSSTRSISMLNEHVNHIKNNAKGYSGISFIEHETAPRPKSWDIQKEANEHPGTFDKIQNNEITTPEELGQAIAEDHQETQTPKVGDIVKNSRSKMIAIIQEIDDHVYVVKDKNNKLHVWYQKETGLIQPLKEGTDNEDILRGLPHKSMLIKPVGKSLYQNMRKALKKKFNIIELTEDGKKLFQTESYPTYGEIEFQGLTIVVENKPGTVRSGTDPDGEKWKTKMFYPYGYIKGTKATDGEGVDVYVGKDKASEKVFIVHQRDPENAKYDEDKVMLGFSTKEAARDAYLAHYDSYKFLGEITEMSIEQFREKLKTRKGKMIKSELSLFGKLLKALKKFTQVPDWQMEFDFGGSPEEPQEGATNQKGETLLPSKVNPKVNRWQKTQQTEPTIEPVSEGRFFNESELREAAKPKEPHEMTFKEYIGTQWSKEREERVLSDLQRSKTELSQIKNGTLSPSKVIGTGVSYPKKTAIQYLEQSIMESDEELKNKYANYDIRNYLYHVIRAQDAGETISPEVQQDAKLLGEKLAGIKHDEPTPEVETTVPEIKTPEPVKQPKPEVKPKKNKGGWTSKLLGLGGTHDRLEKLEPGEMSAVERHFREFKQIEFTSGSTKVKTTDDVAYMFKQLEDEAIEHAFICFVNKTGEPIIQHIGTGSFDYSIVSAASIIPILANNDDIKEVYFVHNHPSGNLDISDADQLTFLRLQNIVNTYASTELKMTGLVIDGKDCKYATFDYDTSDKHSPKFTNDPSKDVKVPVVSFSKLKLKEDVYTDKITSPHQMAEMITKMRFTEGSKANIFILNAGGRVVGRFNFNTYTSATNSRKAQAKEVADLIVTTGGKSAVLAVKPADGDLDINMEDISLYHGLRTDLELLDCKLLDIIKIGNRPGLYLNVVAEL